MERLQDCWWAADGIGGPIQIERHFDGRRFRCFGDRPRNLDDMLRRVVAAYPANEAVVEGPRRICFSDLDDLVDRVAANLSAAGVAPGDRVALLLGNRWEAVVSLFGCVRLGAICVPLGTRQRKPELEFQLNDCGAAVLIVDAELAAVAPTAATVGSLRLRIVVGDDDPATPDGCSKGFDAGFAALLVPTRAGHFPGASEEETALILYTSGTTGKPKGALLTHLGFIHSAYSFARCLQLTSNDRAVLAIPFAHISGLVAVFLSVLCAGGCTVLMRSAYSTAAFLALASTERMSYTVMVPAMYTLCVTHPNLEAHDLSAWRLAAFGGAPMPEATIRLLAEKLPRAVPINAYGATETTSPVTIMPPGQNMSHLDSIGQVVPCGEVVVMGTDGEPVEPGAAGELWIRGPMVVPGYWNRPDANTADFVDGFWRSGDVASVDAEGYVRLLDRIKDMINRGGHKVYSAEVESTLCDHPCVLECAVVGDPDPVLGERVRALVVPRPGAAITAQDIRSFCAERLADYKVPEFVDVLGEPLPRNANGKIQKALLREKKSPRT